MKRLKEYKNNWPIVAICYDFDKTLSPKDMQEFELIPKLGLDSKKFWEESNKKASKNGMDKMLAYMHEIIKRASAAEQPIKSVDFNNMGKSVELFDGVETWFDRINEFCKRSEINVEHYIISAGLREIIEGTKIAKHFKEIFASSFLYDHNEVPCWPKQVVNYTTKTQYLFRINKGCMDLSDEDEVNKYMPSENRRIPFKHFIYIGDSATDIPAMKIVSRENGHSIGVYNPNEINLKYVCDLIEQKRISYYAPANYNENSTIDKLIKQILVHIKKQSELEKESKKLNDLSIKQREMAEDYKQIKGFIDFIIDYAKNNMSELNEIKRYASSYYKQNIKEFEKKYIDYEGIDSIIMILNQDKDKINSFIKENEKDNRKRLMVKKEIIKQH